MRQNGSNSRGLRCDMSLASGYVLYFFLFFIKLMCILGPLNVSNWRQRQRLETQHVSIHWYVYYYYIYSISLMFILGLLKTSK